MSEAQLITKDLEEAHAVLSAEFCPFTLSVSGSTSGFEAKHRRNGFDGMSLHHLTYAADVRVDAEPFHDFVLLTQVMKGRYRIASREGERVLGPGNTVMMDAHTRYRMDFLESCELRQLRIDRPAWQRALADLQGAHDPRLRRFSTSAVPDPLAEKRQRFLMGMVDKTLVPQNWAASDILRTQLIQLAVAILMDQPYDNSAKAAPDRPFSRSVKAAVEYFVANAREDIRIDDVAKAVHLSPRALQETFRREMGMTPLAILRDIRMQGAHNDLRRLGSHETTVAAIAQSWGFANPGRFSSEYHRRFDKAPSDVLRS